MRLNLNEIEYEVEKDLEEFDRFERPGRGAEARVRSPGFGRGRRDAPERDRSRNRVRAAYSKEDSV